jgi:hypothetical protein
VKKIHVKEKDRAIINRLEKTMVEKNPDLEAEKLQNERLQRKSAKEYERTKKQESLEKEKRKAELEAQKRYDNMFEDMTSNKNRANIEDDFM